MATDAGLSGIGTVTVFWNTSEVAWYTVLVSVLVMVGAAQVAVLLAEAQEDQLS